jgi:hypothetical protein
MNIFTKLTLTAAFAAGCGGGEPKKPALLDGGRDSAQLVDAATDGAPGSVPDTGAAGIPLVDFVTGLVRNSNTEVAVPTSIEDKIIIDTMDPAAFNMLLGP